MDILHKYDITSDGTELIELSTGRKMHPFKSNQYLQYRVIDDYGNVRVFGAHQIVAMKYLDDWFPGCVVHHKDENKHNNNIYNLECLSHKKHNILHGHTNNLANYIKKNGPPNKGKKMSDEFREHCRQSALNRHKRNKQS